MPFVPLHLCSHYSLGWGTASIEAIVDRACALGLTRLALTDRDTLAGQVGFHHTCRARGIQPITGVELQEPVTGERLVLLARNETGYSSLCHVVTARAAAPTAPLTEIVGPHAEGLVALSPSPGLMRDLRRSFHADDLGQLVTCAERGGLPGVRSGARKTGPRPTPPVDHDIPQVADLDVLLLYPDDHQLHALQLAVSQRRTLAEMLPVAHRRRQCLLRSSDEVDALFAECPEAVRATDELARRCELDLTTLRPGRPGALPPTADPTRELQRRCEDALHRMRRADDRAARQRLEHELAVLRDQRLCGLMLTVSAIVDHCREQQIEVLCRGSAVGSLVVYLLGASPVDPLEHDLLFERFLHRERAGLPDIDLDLPSQRRDAVVRWVVESLGQGQAAPVGVHQRFQRRAALRLGLQACGASPDELQRVLEALPPDELDHDVDFLDLVPHTTSAEPPREQSAQSGGAPLGCGAERALPNRGQIAPALTLVQQLVGRPRLLAAHPGGVVLTAGPVSRVVPLSPVTQYDARSLSLLGLVKIDLLGNHCLDELARTAELVGHPIEPETTDDRATLELINAGRTIGLFQLESPAMRAVLQRLPIRSLRDVAHALALVRPAAAAARAKAAFVRRAHGEEPVELLDGRLGSRRPP